MADSPSLSYIKIKTVKKVYMHPSLLILHKFTASVYAKILKQVGTETNQLIIQNEG